MGWSVVGLAALAAAVALLLAGLLVAAGLLPRADVPWREATVLVGHGLAGPAVASGLLGLGLVHLAAGPVWRPGAAAIAAGVGVTGVGALVTAVWRVRLAGTLDVAEGTMLMGWVLLSAGWGIGGLGVLAVVAHRRTWPPPLIGALVATAVYGVGSAAVELGWIVPYAFTARPNEMWLQARTVPLELVTVWLLAVGILAEIAREDGAPVALDRALVGLLSVVAVVGVVAPMGSLAPSAAAFALTLAAAAAYTFDAGSRGVLRLRPSQPLGLLAVAMWFLGLGAGAALTSEGVFLHDTFAELVPGHLHGPMLASVLLVAGWVHRLQGPSVGAWLGTAGCALVTALGVWRSALGFAALGLEGVPRRYYDYAPDGQVAWIDIGAGLVLFGVGLGVAALTPAVGAIVRRRASAPG